LKNTQTIISTPSTLPDFDAVELTQDEVETRILTFGVEHHNQRIDRVLVDLVPEFSRSYLQQLIDLGGVCVNEKHVTKASYRVSSSGPRRKASRSKLNPWR
jgi:RNA-binding protein YlmH